VPTTPGHTYTLRFTFSEVWWTAAGSRVLDVRVNGATVLAGADPFAIAGARFTPGVQEVTVVAGAGAGMTVSFVTVIDNATLSALEVSTGGLWSYNSMLSSITLHWTAPRQQHVQQYAMQYCCSTYTAQWRSLCAGFTCFKLCCTAGVHC
jgi:hypothetical protein